MDKKEKKRVSMRCLSARGKSKEIYAANETRTLNTLNLCALSEPEKQALANLMPLLICGEESATFVFDDLAKVLADKLSEAHIKDLNSITQDEVRHSDHLEILRDHLPAPLDRRAVYRVAVFLKVLKSNDAILQLSLLAALDAAVCQLLSALLRPETPLSNCTQVAHMLSRIQLDEARHVRITRDCYLALGLSRDQSALAQTKVLEAFIALLQPTKDDLKCLGTDLALLIKRWRTKSDTCKAMACQVGNHIALQHQSA